MKLAWLALVVLSGCPAAPSDPPPPPTKPEIAVAPPHALGARAGGTDAAPRPETAPEFPGMPLLPKQAAPEVAPSPDGGAPAAGAPSVPDAGMAL